MAEAVRLVVWDLDETFWKGTLTEGGIREYVIEHHNIVIELAKRGIVSSICSKNDRDVVLKILEEQGIRDYFIFSSISWQPKGLRLAQLVSAVQLRATTVMFIDDNPNNLGEAQAAVPGLQVESEKFIPLMLSDPRFKGKSDSDLSRLKQYQLLDRRQSDEQSAAGSNEDFLRKCDIRVLIENDVDTHLDRAVELINRTNQLNYTKLRLPEDPEQARRTLQAHLGWFGSNAGLIRVKDKYGDYGFVGFFLMVDSDKAHVSGALSRLMYFCFSCRTLGMLVEQWVYEHLGQPEIEVVGEVLTDLSVPRNIDWIRQVASLDREDASLPKITSNLVFWGGCEVNAIGPYLNGHADKIHLMGSYVANNVFVVTNYASRFLDRLDRHTSDDAAYREEIRRLGLPENLETAPLLAPGNDSLFVFKFSSDVRWAERLRHKIEDWPFILAPRGLPFELLTRESDEKLVGSLTQEGGWSFSTSEIAHMRALRQHIQENYEIEPVPEVAEILAEVRCIIERLPVGAAAIFIVDHPEQIDPDGKSRTIVQEGLKEYNRQLLNVVAQYNYAAVISFSEVIESPDDLQGGDHYSRAAYFRMSQRIVEVGSTLPRRSDFPASARRVARLGQKQALSELGALQEARTVVQATFEVLLRRAPDPEWAEQEARKIVSRSGAWHSGDFIRSVGRSGEFAEKWSPRNPDEVTSQTPHPGSARHAVGTALGGAYAAQAAK